MFRPFRARGIVLGPVDPGLQPGLRYFAPLGLTCPPSPPRRGKTDYARRRVKTVFPFSRRWTATGVLTSRRGQGAPRSACRGDEGSLPARERQMKMFFLLQGEKVAEGRGRMRGHFPSGLAANKEYSFILLHTSADKRSGRVSGALRGGKGRETGLAGWRIR